MSQDNPTAEEIIESEAKGQRRETQHIAHDDTVGIAIRRVFRLGSKHLFYVPEQTKIFFGQGTSENGNDDLGVPYRKTAAETSLSKGKETPNKQAMAITGLSLSRRGVRAKIDQASLGTVGGLLTVTDFTKVLTGDMELIDRAGLILPFELGGHPGFLEDVLDAIRSRAVLIPKFGTKVEGDPIRADRVPCGDATSGLRAAGMPENFNRYKLPIGFLWRPSNASADSEFTVKLVIPKPFFVTVNAPECAFNTDAENPAYADVDTAMIDFTLRAHGKAIAPVSGNAG
jgi:hypothetical protein